MTSKICVLGSYVCQMSVILPHEPILGETIVAQQFDMGQGGKGHNVAIGINRLGAEVVLIEKIGHDMFGKMALECYADEGIDSRFIQRTDQSSSGIGLVYIQKNGENTAAYYPGANNYLAEEDVEKAREEIQSASILYLQLEIPDEPILAAVSLAHTNVNKIILNPAPARTIPQDLLQYVDVLTPNQVEAFTLVNEDYQKDLTRKDMENLGTALLDLGPSEVFLTLGSQGAFYINQEGNSIFQPCLEVDVVDTVGAGDAFNAALCFALANNSSPEEALFRACVNGALTTTRIGVFNALPTSAEVEEFIAAYNSSSGKSNENLLPRQ
ncbi:MAG: ribokinase [Anaerolineales bacterium]|nr:ribokinase [Anaerolineales bacterium]